MKPRIIAATVVAVAVALAGTAAALAQQGPRVDHWTQTDAWQGVLFSCDDGAGGSFDVLNRWEAIGQNTMKYDKYEQPLELLAVWKYPVDVIWNPRTEKTLQAGPNEIQQMRLIFEDGVPVALYESGAIIKLNVPGYGLVYAETGHVRIDLSTGGIVFISGHNDMWAGFSAQIQQAICNALR